MIKRTLLALGLGLGLAGGVVSATHTTAQVHAHPAAVHTASQAHTNAYMAAEAKARAADTDPTAPCGTDATGAQTGDCQDSQNAAGPEDNAGSSSEEAASGPDTDTLNVQQ
jgi:hypothetical protein